jgi:myo-inositol-1(or 4)-monophosphatase
MNLSNLCNQVLPIVETVVQFIANESLKFSDEDIEYKGLRNLVSYVDKKAEAILFDRLSALLPEAGFLAEEGTEKALDSEWLWVIDPLDGTTNFLHKIPIFAVSVGLLHLGKPVLGVVAEVNRREFFYAWQGGGSYLNGSKIAVSKNDKIEQALIATGFPYQDSGKTTNNVALLVELLKSARGLRRLGSAATDMCFVAAGRFDGFYEYNLSAWDVAAGAIIITEAGGTVSDFRGTQDFIFGKELIAAGAVYSPFFEIVAKYFH